MKLSSKLEKLKQRLQRRKKQAAKEAGHTAGRPALPAASTWVLLGLCLLLAGLGTLAVFEFFVWTRVPPELVGLWEVEEGPQKGGTFEFFRDGTMEVHLQAKKRTVGYKMRVAVRDKTLVITPKGSQSPENTPAESIIRELTADTLILELEKGDVLKLVRIE
jgi:hypothetical protein